MINPETREFTSDTPDDWWDIAAFRIAQDIASPNAHVGLAQCRWADIIREESQKAGVVQIRAISTESCGVVSYLDGQFSIKDCVFTGPCDGIQAMTNTELHIPIAINSDGMNQPLPGRGLGDGQ